MKIQINKIKTNYFSVGSISPLRNGFHQSRKLVDQVGQQPQKDKKKRWNKILRTINEQHKMLKLFNVETHFQTIFLDLFFFLCLNISQMVQVLFTDPNKMMFNDPNNWATQQIIQQFAVHNSLNSQFIALKVPFLCHFSWRGKNIFHDVKIFFDDIEIFFQDVKMFFLRMWKYSFMVWKYFSGYENTFSIC